MVGLCWCGEEHCALRQVLCPVHQHRLCLDAVLNPVLVQALPTPSHSHLSIPLNRESLQWLDPAGKLPIRKKKQNTNPEIFIPLDQPGNKQLSVFFE